MFYLVLHHRWRAGQTLKFAWMSLMGFLSMAVKMNGSRRALHGLMVVIITSTLALHFIPVTFSVIVTALRPLFSEMRFHFLAYVLHESYRSGVSAYVILWCVCVCYRYECLNHCLVLCVVPEGVNSDTTLHGFQPRNNSLSF